MVNLLRVTARFISYNDKKVLIVIIIFLLIKERLGLRITIRITSWEGKESVAGMLPGHKESLEYLDNPFHIIRSHIQMRYQTKRYIIIG
jgi:hypothetical protein